MGNLGLQELLLLFIIIGIPTVLIVLLVLFFSKKNTSKNTASNLSVADELAKLHTLKEKGIITQEKFENKKAKLI